jgi:hypothetical protein
MGKGEGGVNGTCFDGRGNYPPAIAPITMNGSSPEATASGSIASGDSRDKTLFTGEKAQERPPLQRNMRGFPDASRLRQTVDLFDASLVRPYPTPQSVVESANSVSSGPFHLSPQDRVRASPFACRQP